MRVGAAAPAGGPRKRWRPPPRHTFWRGGAWPAVCCGAREPKRGPPWAESRRQPAACARGARGVGCWNGRGRKNCRNYHQWGGQHHTRPPAPRTARGPPRPRLRTMRSRPAAAVLAVRAWQVAAAGRAARSRRRRRPPPLLPTTPPRQHHPPTRAGVFSCRVSPTRRARLGAPPPPPRTSTAPAAHPARGADTGPRCPTADAARRHRCAAGRVARLAAAATRRCLAAAARTAGGGEEGGFPTSVAPWSCCRSRSPLPSPPPPPPSSMEAAAATGAAVLVGGPAGRNRGRRRQGQSPSWRARPLGRLCLVLRRSHFRAGQRRCRSGGWCGGGSGHPAAGLDVLGCLSRAFFLVVAISTPRCPLRATLLPPSKLRQLRPVIPVRRGTKLPQHKRDAAPPICKQHRACTRVQASRGACGDNPLPVAVAG